MTYVVLAGDLVPAGTTLVTPSLICTILLEFWRVGFRKILLMVDAQNINNFYPLQTVVNISVHFDKISD